MRAQVFGGCRQSIVDPPLISTWPFHFDLDRRDRYRTTNTEEHQGFSQTIALDCHRLTRLSGWSDGELVQYDGSPNWFDQTPRRWVWCKGQSAAETTCDRLLCQTWAATAAKTMTPPT
jgi:hypothetical protein